MTAIAFQSSSGLLLVTAAGPLRHHMVSIHVESVPVQMFPDANYELQWYVVYAITGCRSG